MILTYGNEGLLIGYDWDSECKWIRIECKLSKDKVIRTWELDSDPMLKIKNQNQFKFYNVNLTVTIFYFYFFCAFYLFSFYLWSPTIIWMWIMQNFKNIVIIVTYNNSKVVWSSK